MPKLNLGKKIKFKRAKKFRVATAGSLNTFARRGVARVNKFIARAK